MRKKERWGINISNVKTASNNRNATSAYLIFAQSRPLHATFCASNLVSTPRNFLSTIPTIRKFGVMLAGERNFQKSLFERGLLPCSAYSSCFAATTSGRPKEQSMERGLPTWFDLGSYIFVFFGWKDGMSSGWILINDGTGWWIRLHHTQRSSVQRKFTAKNPTLRICEPVFNEFNAIRDSNDRRSWSGLKAQVHWDSLNPKAYYRAGFQPQITAVSHWS